MSQSGWVLAAGLAVGVAGAMPQDARRAPLRGSVVADHTGLPVPGATLLLVRPGETFAAREIRTDATGGFDLAGLQPADYRIEVSADGYADATVDIPAGIGQDDIALHLVRHGQIDGRAIGPAAGNVVLIENVPEGVTPRQVRASLGDGGAFRLWPVPTGAWVLGIMNPQIDGRIHRGFATASESGGPRPVIITGGEMMEEVIQMAPAPTYAISGRAVSTDGPFGGRVSARVRPAGWPNLSIATRLLRDDNVFRFEDLLPGTYVVAGAENVIGIGPDGERRGEVTVELYGSDVTVDVPMRVWHSPSSAAVDAEPEPGALGFALPSEDAPAIIAVVAIDVTPGRASPIRIALARPGQHLTIADLAPGRYYVAARAAADAATRWAPPTGLAPEFVEVRSGETTAVMFR